ncbi:hypothetical protein C0Q70_08129 [Pomacea canaliculata]|uniref:Uncharacterized protein n=1 Tax=Pomacea canaliculata TaxID=400727 RepID=A0A2T7PGZ0_POMCA|nr:hypothetical protein C0Q70_08129 [Pomacea canaliculata]
MDNTIASTSTTDFVNAKQTTEATLIDTEEARKYGIDMPTEEEFIYEPLQRDDTLPDLHNLLQTLEDGETNLESVRQPPSLFTQPEHIPNYERISELRLEIEQEEVAAYLADFEAAVAEDVVMLGSISLEEVQEEEKRLRDEHVAYLQQEAVAKRQRLQELLQREEEVKLRVAQFVKDKRKEIANREELLKQREKLLMERLHRGFRKAESQLISVVEDRKGEVKTFFGDLMTSEGQYGGVRGRRWKVDWNKTPQPIQIKVKCLRGVKDKLPAGRYVLMVSLYNRLGGHSMRWSKLRGQQWGGATLPLFHEGNFHNVEMKVEQNLFTVLPAKASLRPGMVLMFELFLLRGSVVNTDHVVGWGAFPICDGQFEIVEESEYKCPMLRGQMDADISKHEKIEELMASDLDHWLCNLYFHVIKLPRYFAGQKEYEVELQFTSGLTGHPDRLKTGWEENKDGEDPVPGSSSDLGSDSASQGISQLSLSSTGDSGNASLRTTTSTAARMQKTQDKKKKPSAGTTILSRIINRDTRRLKFDDSSDEEAETLSRDPHDIYALQKERDFKPVPGMNGMPPFSTKGHLARKGREKMNYIARMFLAELGLSQWRSQEFWFMILLFLIIFWLRLYLHYVGQWLFLNAISIPVNKFNFLPYTVELNYQPTLMRTRDEIAVVVFGPLMDVVAFSLLVVFSWLSQKIFGTFPDIFSKFVMAFGIMTFFDPLLILVVDCAQKTYIDSAINPIGDFAKLYWHFYRSQGSGLAGIFITLFLYTCIAFIVSSILYMYFLRLHNEGRMLDVFWRLHGEEDHFFLPYDLELSNQELSYLCRRVEQWRGEEGERRKVAVYDYIWEEEELDEDTWDASQNGDTAEERQAAKEKLRREVTTHVSIHTLHLDGLRELHRHFLRLPDGAVVEVFGDITVPGMDKDVKKALEHGSLGLEDLSSSRTSLQRIRNLRASSSRRTSSSSGSIPKKDL